MKDRQSGSALQTLGSLASVASYFKLGSGKAQLELIRQVAISQQQVFEKQSQLKQLIFEIRHFLEKELPGIEDKVVARVKVDLLTNLIEDSRIGTPSFLEISDKEYFSTTAELLKKASTELSPFEKEADLILATLRRLRVIMKQLSLDEQSFLRERGNVKSPSLVPPVITGVVMFLVTLALSIWGNPYLASGLFVVDMLLGIYWFGFRRRDDGMLLRKINECLEGYGSYRIPKLDSYEASRAFRKAGEDLERRIALIIERHPLLEELLLEANH